MIIEIEKGKNYAARFYYKDVFGKMHRPYKSGFPSRKAAQQWETQERARLDGDPVTTDGITFAYLFKEWRKNLIRQAASPRTLQKYEDYHRYVSDFLDHLALNKINEHIIQKLIDIYQASPATCNELRKMLNAAFNYARKKRWLRENPMYYVDVPAYRPKRVPAYNFDDIRELFASLREDNSKLYTPVLCACLFAASREEVCALQESDIVRLHDGNYRVVLDKAFITVRRQSIIKSQKTENRYRTFIFSSAVYDELHAYKTKNGISSPFVCCNKNGSNIKPNTISNSFSRFLKTHGLKYTTFHKLRDAYANACKRLHVDLDTAYRMMGHASYKTTAEYYASADDVLTAEAVSKIEHELFAVR